MPATSAPKPRITIIDADGLLFAAALKGETTCDGRQMEMRLVEQTYADLLKRIEQAMEECGAEECYLALSDRRNFRYELMPPGHPLSIKELGYKGNRGSTPRPLQLDRLRGMVVEESPYKVFLIQTLEADDVCGIMSGVLQAQGRDVVIHSPDKDLATIPGKLYAKGKVTEVTQEMADRFHIMQTLCGDTVDNYRGCPGWGARKAGQLFDLAAANGWTPEELWLQVIGVFEEAGYTAEQCLDQARVARILRVTDWDAVKKEPLLFQFPVE